MYRILAAISLTSASLLGQNHLTTPPTGTNVDGNDACFIFGWAANQKQRFMDATHAGTARNLKSLSFRPDYRDHKAIGRTWSNVKLYVAHGDYSSIAYNKSTAFKLTTTPTKVFDAKWSFPALSGKPVFNPASWGGVQSSLRFRYSSPWSYNGKDAVFHEFQFSGGVAANNVPWIGTQPKGFEYYLDTMSQDDWRGTGKGGGGNHYGKSCIDSWFVKSPAKLSMSLSGASQISLGIESYYTSPLNPVIYAVGFSGSATGVDIGTGCANFHLTPPLVLLPQAAPKNQTAYAKLSLTGTRQTWMKEFWAQAGWADTKSNSLKLSNAASIDKPGGGGKLVPAVTSYQVGAFQVWTAAPKGMPFLRYEY